MRRLPTLFMLAATLTATSAMAEPVQRQRPPKSEALMAKHTAVTAKIHTLRATQQRNGAQVLALKGGLRVLVSRQTQYDNAPFVVNGKVTADGEVQLLNARERATTTEFLKARASDLAIHFNGPDKTEIAKAFNPNKAALMALGIR